MTNTEDTQSSVTVFSARSVASTGQQLRGSVGQDNPTPPPARSASPQPAPQKKAMRPQPLNTNLSRSQNTPKAKRKTVHLTIWLKPVVKAALQRLAESEGLSISATGAALLERALQTTTDMQYGALLQPIIEQAIRQQMRNISTRLAWLLVRVAYDAGQTRSLVTNILGRQAGVSPDVLKTILDSSSKTAKGNITRRTPQLTELIQAVEQWMVAGEGT